MAQVRYLVSDVDDTVSFYRDQLGFELQQQFGPAMAILVHDDLQLWVAGPASSAAKPMPNGEQPEPGGWARIVVSCPDLDDKVASLRTAGVRFRNDIVTGPGGRQILIEDPSGNAIELFEPGDAV